MTATTAETRFLGLPKNKTGLFAADTLQEVKQTKSHVPHVPGLSPQQRHTGSVNLLLASAEQNYRHLQQYRLSNNEIHQYYPTANPATTNNPSADSQSSINGQRNGFRPSTVRHLPLRTAPRSGDSSSSHHDDRREMLNSASTQGGKQSFIQSRASARLKCEIDEINSKLKRHTDSSKSGRFQNNWEMISSPPSALSYSTSCRLSSASTTQTADRIHQRFTSALTNGTVNTNVSVAAVTGPDVSQQSPLPETSPILIPTAMVDTDNHQHHPTHAYQVPQQSNVGMDNVLLLNPSNLKTRLANIAHQRNNNGSISCPFYVMYFTQLALQQRQASTHHKHVPSSVQLPSAIRKVPLNSRMSTAYSRNSPGKRQVTTPSSANTYMTLFDDDVLPSRITPSTHHTKSLSAKMTAFENETSHLLQDVLRTTSWNHVQV